MASKEGKQEEKKKEEEEKEKMLPQQDKQKTNERTNKERQGYSANGLWKAEMSKYWAWLEKMKDIKQQKSVPIIEIEKDDFCIVPSFQLYNYTEKRLNEEHM